MLGLLDYKNKETKHVHRHEHVGPIAYLSSWQASINIWCFFLGISFGRLTKTDVIEAREFTKNIARIFTFDPCRWRTRCRNHVQAVNSSKMIRNDVKTT